ncbi:MAG: AAA family ATPase [Candidatus Jordarchaeales archaeon]
MKKKVIGIVGMPGSGKSVAAQVARNEGLPVVSMGDVIREVAALQGIPPSPENIGRIMIKIREEEGEDVVARKCMSKIDAKDSDVVVVEGVRSLAEVKAFKEGYSDFVLIGVYASPKTRLKRLAARGREDDPKTIKHFIERDERELQVGVGAALALADYMIVNEGRIEEFKAKVKEILGRIINENKSGDTLKADRGPG